MDDGYVQALKAANDRFEAAEAALERWKREVESREEALSSQTKLLAEAQAKVARLRANAADVRRKALEEALSIVQREKDSGRHPDKLARVIHELRALAAREEVGRGRVEDANMRLEERSAAE